MKCCSKLPCWPPFRSLDSAVLNYRSSWGSKNGMEREIKQKLCVQNRHLTCRYWAWALASELRSIVSLRVIIKIKGITLNIRESERHAFDLRKSKTLKTEKTRPIVRIDPTSLYGNVEYKVHFRCHLLVLITP